MNPERDEYLDLIIDAMRNPRDMITLEKQIPSELRFTIGTVADRVRERLIPELTEEDAKKIAEEFNVHPKTVHRMRKKLGTNQP